MSRSKCESSGLEAGTAKKHQVIMMKARVKMIESKQDKIIEHVKYAVPKIEKFLSVWTQNQHHLCEDLKKKHSEESEGTSFNVSHDWFHYFQQYEAEASVSLSLREPKNIEKGSLPIMWKSNPKSWVTQVIFRDLFFHHFISEVEKHCLEEGIPFNILLLLVSAPGQPPSMDSFHPIVRVVHLPPYTASLIKPTDQEVITTFKKYYLHHTFHQAVKVSDKSGRTLLQFWKDYNSHKAIKAIDLAYNFVTLSEKLELELQEDGFTELLAVQQEELTNADLMELRKRKNEERQEEEEVMEEPKGFRMQEMARGIFFLSEEAMLVFEEQDLNAEWYTKVATTLQKAIQCYHIIHDEKKNNNNSSNNNNKELLSRHLWIAFPKGR
ncbi:hypothetical protein FD755_012294 [Muntiacus reevesi]|uniref:DDE-1 domain-containing protein n=1 Tax=Muntiacus reevesi TaxID=9886 RepID=A0A5N3XT06_MUNRE|nr:hypothetical protein FD755_012294 [Muntiacus reevesi]